MDIPDDIQRLAKEAQTKKRAQEIKEREEKRARQAAEEERRKKYLAEGIAHAKFIFDWAKEFAADPVGQSIIKICSWGFLNGVMFFDDKLDGHAFRGLGVSKDGVWWMRTGCGAHPVWVKSPTALAEEIEPEILAAAVESIKSGRVWRVIKNRREFK